MTFKTPTLSSRRFILAHAITKVIACGADYRATFGMVLKALIKSRDLSGTFRGEGRTVVRVGDGDMTFRRNSIGLLRSVAGRMLDVYTDVTAAARRAQDEATKAARAAKAARSTKPTRRSGWRRIECEDACVFGAPNGGIMVNDDGRWYQPSV